MKTFDDEQLLNSLTFQRLSALAEANPVNTNDDGAVAFELATSLVGLIEVLDRDAITFKGREDSGALWRLMLTCHQLLTQIRPTSPVKH